MGLITLYRRCSNHEMQKLRLKFDGLECSPILKEAEFCYYAVFNGDQFQPQDMKKLKFLLTPPFSTYPLMEESKLIGLPDINLIEIGPRLTFTTPFSTNATSACSAAGLKQIRRIERSTRFKIDLEDKDKIFEVTEFIIIYCLISAFFCLLYKFYQ